MTLYRDHGNGIYEPEEGPAELEMLAEYILSDQGVIMEIHHEDHRPGMWGFGEDQASGLRELVAAHGKATYEPFESVVRRLQDELAVPSPPKLLGRTTSQIVSAPFGSFYVWLHEHTAHPKHLAALHNRTDLKIVGPDWVRIFKWLGLDRQLTTIVFDNATCNIDDPKFWKNYGEIVAR